MEDSMIVNGIYLIEKVKKRYNGAEKSHSSIQRESIVTTVRATGAQNSRSK
jgi:hypothetical protein